MILEALLYLAFNGFHHRRIFGIKPEKEYPLTTGFGVIVFQKAVGSNIAVQDINLGIRIFFFNVQCIFNGRLTTYPGAVGVLFIPGSDALDHDLLFRLFEFAFLHPLC